MSICITGNTVFLNISLVIICGQGNFGYINSVDIMIETAYHVHNRIHPLTCF